MKQRDGINRTLGGKYVIEGELGSGTSGICYKVRSIANGNRYAMKRISGQLMRKNNLKQASTQVSLLSTLNHPNIIRYHDSFCEEGYLHIVMQYAVRGDLHQIIKRRRTQSYQFTEEELWEMAHQLVDALRYLHEQNIMHRDVKTLNIFVSSEGKYILGDLGVSKHLNNELGAFSRVGTPLYLAPQIIQYDKYDFKADIWSLGCVLYLASTLDHPFEGNNLITLGQKIVNTEPKPILTRSPRWAQLVKDTLIKDQKTRLSAKQLLQKYFATESLTQQSAKIITAPKVIPNRRLVSAQGSLRKVNPYVHYNRESKQFDKSEQHEFIANDNKKIEAVNLPKGRDSMSKISLQIGVSQSNSNKIMSLEKDDVQIVNVNKNLINESQNKLFGQSLSKQVTKNVSDQSSVDGQKTTLKEPQPQSDPFQETVILMHPSQKGHKRLSYEATHQQNRPYVFADDQMSTELRIRNIINSDEASYKSFKNSKKPISESISFGSNMRKKSQEAVIHEGEHFNNLAAECSQQSMKRHTNTMTELRSNFIKAYDAQKIQSGQDRFHSGLDKMASVTGFGYTSIDSQSHSQPISYRKTLPVRPKSCFGRNMATPSSLKQPLKREPGLGHLVQTQVLKTPQFVIL